jgi:3-deoxy-D-manno-octulosonic-acid transferase
MSETTGIDRWGLAEAAYSAAWSLAAAFCRPVLAASRLLGRETGWLEGKLGLHSRAESHAPTCWIHASSVGEAGIALRCIAALRRIRPDLRFVLTVVTPEGAKFAQQRLSLPDRLAWFPFDAPSCVRRAFDAFTPEFIVLCEVELWPNHLREARSRGIPVIVVNGRLAETDEKNYRRGGSFIRRVFALLGLVCARTEADAGRFVRLGAQQVIVTGDMKFDPLPESDVDGAMNLPRDSLILLGASTHPGEEAVLMNILRSARREFPGLVLVLVPRHPSRAAAIRAEAVHLGLHPVTDCMVVDTVGQLPSLFRQSTLAFVGKSLTAKGGQNFLEAVEAGCPVIFGPHMENFSESAGAFVAADAVRQVRDSADLAAEILSLLHDPAQRSELAHRASVLLETQKGATERTVELILQQLSSNTPANKAFTAH